MPSDPGGLSQPVPPEPAAEPAVETDADRVVAAVVGVPGVRGLHAGAHGEVATYLPGRRVRGLRLLEPGCEVHVVLDWGASIAETTELVREAVRALVGAPVHVVVEDVAPPDAGTAQVPIA